MVNKVLR